MSFLRDPDPLVYSGFNERCRRKHPDLRISLFGGSFNPPHVGHLLVCTWLLATRAADEVWLVPTWKHPFDKPLASWEDRLALCEALAVWIGEGVRVCEIESELDGKSYTVRAIEALQARHPSHDFELVLGSDLLEELPSWHEADRLRSLVPIRVVQRAGFQTEIAEASPVFPRVSSTRIRERLASGQPVDALVPAVVLDLITARGLYRKASAEA